MLYLFFIKKFMQHIFFGYSICESFYKINGFLKFCCYHLILHKD